MEKEERPRKILKTEANGDSLKLGSDFPIMIPDDVGDQGSSTEKSSPDGEDTVEENHGVSEDDHERHGGIVNGENEQTLDPPLSKNQLKKLKRQQDWEAGRAHRRVKRKEKLVQKRERKRVAKDEEREQQGASDKAGDITDLQQSEPKKPHHQRSTQLPITFVFDCSFDELMTEKERISLASQLTRCYSDNHKAPFKAHMVVSSFNGKLKERFEGLLGNHHHSWRGVRFLDEDFAEAAEQAKDWMAAKEGGILAGAIKRSRECSEDESSAANGDSGQGEVIYLTSDSPDTLAELKPYSTYIIGGLVDKNRHKGICYKRATDRNIKTAKLPIGDYMQMTSRFVLATNHVNEIMIRWLELGDWGEAFLQVVPKRKGGVLKTKMSNEYSTAIQQANELEDSLDTLEGQIS
jgi:tRNA (guanine9-N1)-methyltransferase